MSDGRPRRYYAALVVSAISTLAWLAALGGILLTGYLALTGDPAIEAAAGTLVVVVVAIAGAQLERRLYRLDRDE